MRIIHLGNIDVQFSCLRCSTIFEINTSELRLDDEHNYYTQCPLCGERMYIRLDNINDSFAKFLRKREELKNEMETERKVYEKILKQGEE